MGGNLTKKKSFKKCFKWRAKFVNEEVKNAVKNSRTDEEKAGQIKESPNVDYKVYESYGCYERVVMRKSRSLNPDIKLFRRSYETSRWNSKHRAHETGENPPRSNSFGQEQLIRSRPIQVSESQSNGQRRKRTSSSLTRHCVKRHSSSLSLHSIGYRVDSRDFPNAQTVRRKCRQFEITFVRCVTSTHLNSTDRDLFSLLSIGTSNETQGLFVSIADCVKLKKEGKTLRDQLKPIIPAKLFQVLLTLMETNDEDNSRWSSFAKEVFTSVALSASKELSRMFEYQIALVGNGLSLEAASKYAAECSMDHVMAKELPVNINSIVEGVLLGKPLNSSPPLTLSVLIGERELKWRLQEIFTKPALRREILLFQNHLSNVLPWEFLVTSESDPMLYGYRGLMLERDFINETYRVHKHDEQFVTTFPWSPEDFHRHYLPRKRLIGDDLVENFKSINSDPTARITLNDHVTSVTGRKYVAEEIEPLYRNLKQRMDETFDDLRRGALKVDPIVRDEEKLQVESLLPEIIYSNNHHHDHHDNDHDHHDDHDHHHGDPDHPSSPAARGIRRRPSMAVIKFALTPTHAPASTDNKNDPELNYLTSKQLNMVELKDLMSTNKISTSVEDSATRSFSADGSTSDISICDSHDTYASGNIDFSLATSFNSNSNAFSAASQRLYKSLDETFRQENKGDATTRSFTFSHNRLGPA